ncbi:unnamed protein product [Arctia plantaginis]|uniref:Uncharacterized protein n=1 Tax=Arctia plantaginis TaxID=874455 RepID=A0A8S0Z289_ARCPL|nr:unnamed protein product [Arctia plantaginis]
MAPYMSSALDEDETIDPRYEEADPGQKTRNPQQRRMYAGSRARPSLTTHEPTIYVSPSNLPPPPKYECMAPPSYEEVVGVHYPDHQTQQPISHPITSALAQSNNNNTRTVDPLPATNDSPPPTINQVPAAVTVTTVNERQTAAS